MKHVDTLIVGFGLAGLAYAEVLHQEKKSFHVIDTNTGGSSVIAAGIYNPTLLKRFTMTWRGAELHQIALPFYEQIEKRLNNQFLFPATIYKLFSQIADHNDWIIASEKNNLSLFLDDKIYNTPIKGIRIPFGYGKVNLCGRLNTKELINQYKATISHFITPAHFDYSSLIIDDKAIQYGSIRAKRLVFCEGFAMKKNPFFNDLPLVGSKGQILLIKSTDLKSSQILKGPIFIAPMGNDMYWAGASFEQNDKTLECTTDARNWLIDKIKKMISVPFTIVDQLTHIRPTVKDRRPLIGTHPKFSNIHLLNGLGSRGVLTAPQAAYWLFHSIERGEALPKEVNISRFKKTT